MALERFATKKDLLATTQELRQEIDGAKRQFEALIEVIGDDIRLVAERLATLIERLERKGVI